MSIQEIFRRIVNAIPTDNTKDEYNKLNTINPEDADYLKFSPSVIGYESAEEQLMFYQDILSPVRVVEDSILDLGCGRADLLSYLKAMRIEPNYTGLDRNPALIDIAKENHDNVKFTNELVTASSKLDEVDWILGCNFFNEYLEATNYDYQDMCIFLVNANKYSRKGIKFNIDLQKAVDAGNYTTPGIIFDMLRFYFTYVSVTQGFTNKNNYFFTIYKGE